jgi:hypothetical protein
VGKTTAVLKFAFKLINLPYFFGGRVKKMLENWGASGKLE